LSAIFVDADACPVKGEVYRVAARYGLRVFVVSNQPLRTPPGPLVEAVVAGERFDAVDDWIAAQAGQDDIVVTGDIPLASRCLKQGARVLNPKGRAFTDDNIGEALAAREISAHLRELGLATGGPAPFVPRDRARFLQRLDAIIQSIRRAS
jgi:uncharacterized protein YaiI (UPF0178 family)